MMAGGTPPPQVWAQRHRRPRAVTSLRPRQRWLALGGLGLGLLMAAMTMLW
jgi:hypothetical protein